MSRRVRRVSALSGVAGLLAVAGIVAVGTPAVAEDVFKVVPQDVILPPASYWDTAVGMSGTTSAVGGKLVLAFSAEPLTGAESSAGLPASFVMQHNPCEKAAGYNAVFICRTGPDFQRPPTFLATRDAADMTTVYRGYAYVPQGGDLSAGIEAALSANARPAGTTHGASKAVVKTREHAERNTVGFTLQDVAAGKSAWHETRLHAPDGGRIHVRFDQADGQVATRGDRIMLSELTSGPGASCVTLNPQISSSWHSVRCTLEPGDHTIGYRLTAPPAASTFKLETVVQHSIYSAGIPADHVESVGPFAVSGAPVHPKHAILGRDTTGSLYLYAGSGNADRPFMERRPLGGTWQTYNALTRLSPLAEDLQYQDLVPAEAMRGRGDLITRDASGTLWYHHRQNLYNGEPYAARVKAGTGWNIYNQLTGAGDVNRDGHMDLLARDNAGVLWLYPGTGNLTTGARFTARIKAGTGWNIYNQVAAGTDLSGDGTADLLARDTTGALWLYKGTGNPTAPYAARIKAGTGWNIYNQLTLSGDLTNDGKADAIARDTSGALWLYKGTGNPTAPYAARTQIGTGWNIYNSVL
ncbi:VCBS repeat-containing protein [Streptomyces sp. ISL-36]|uniref:FG-GAP repeat domain-containing protein n=1 Tax=Streptomyces sp. ISL-36 TaxID=2819182 RepID=UPI001BE6E27B|nr:VCBS repeat-containing protein [Streptomyces sp. ISL-36]MBT2441828.1 VCBS repeat-containing protein [Streptomyces sp. ISL-36]